MAEEEGRGGRAETRSSPAPLARRAAPTGVEQHKLSFVRRHVLAGPALPTCRLALTESERVAADATSAIEDALARLRLDDTPITLRMTGCSNGCTRPYNADLGIVGRKPGHYDVFVAGGLEGHRLGELYAESVAMERLVAELEPRFEDWAKRREPLEGLGDFYDRCVRTEGRRDIQTGAKGALAARSKSLESAAS